MNKRLLFAGIFIIFCGCVGMPPTSAPPGGKDWFTYNQRFFFSMAQSSTQTYQQGNYQITETRTSQQTTANILTQPVDKPMEKPILAPGMTVYTDYIYGPQPANP